MGRSDRGSGGTSSLGRPASLRRPLVGAEELMCGTAALRVQTRPAALSAVSRAQNPRGIKCVIPPCSTSLRNYHLVSFRMPTKKNTHNYPTRQLIHSSPFPPPYLCDARFSTQTVVCQSRWPDWRSRYENLVVFRKVRHGKVFAKM